ncbi:MAG TPA: hypothetical protein VHB50_13390 [Bryobacteraceae bacterium]|nr:hypothetical protein [Bryobacteraceae bacterium]
MALIACLIGYVVLLSARSMTSPPTGDEALVANPAYNLTTHGYMGTTIVENPRWPNVARYTFNTLPAGILFVASIFKLAGCSLLAARAPSMFFALLALMAVYVVVLQVTSSRNHALLSTALVALDYNYLAAATCARGDMMTFSFALLAQAAYLSLRRQSLNLAILSSSTLMVLAGLTHPVAILFTGCLAMVILYFDHARIRPVHIMLALAPLAAGFAAWYSYYRLDPDDARIQLMENFNHAHRPVYGIKAVAACAWHELRIRYLHGATLHRFHLPNVLCAVSYIMSLGGVVLWPRARKGATPLLIGQTALLAGYFALLEPSKFPSYMAYVSPFYAILAARIILEAWKTHRRSGWIVTTLFLLVAATGVAKALDDVRLDEYHREDLAAAQFLSHRADPADLVSEPISWGFSYGFERNAYHDVGLRFRRMPEFIVLQQELPEYLHQLKRGYPDRYLYLEKVFAQFHCIYRSARWSIYQQNSFSRFP